MKLNKIVTRSENFADWYTSVIQASKLITYASVKGTVNYLPRGWAIWTNIVNELDRRLKTSGAQNVQLPLFIRTSDFLKEVDQVEGFAPETFIVDRMGTEKIEDPLIVRPTSEVLFSQLFKDQIMSYKDLPLKYNQWCSVYRAEKTTKPFLRGSEFFWQELHAMFENKESCEEYVLQIHKLYNDFLKYILCLPVLSGKKTEGEKFPGAVDTYTREVWSQDCQCIQAGTSHYLGTNFSKMYDVKFQDKSNTFSMPHYMSAGMTTRLLGCLIVVHGDDKGLVLPFNIAPTQICILTMFANKEPKVLEKAKDLQSELNKYSVSIDDSDNGFGYKISEQEINGTPFCIAIGPRDLENGTAMLIRRDNSLKQTIKFDDLKKEIDKQVIEYNTNLYEKAKKHMEDSIVSVSNIEEFKKAIENKKIVLAPWCGIAEEEKKLKLATNGVTPRCIKEDNLSSQTCFFTGKPAKQMVYFARAY